GELGLRQPEKIGLLDQHALFRWKRFERAANRTLLLGGPRGRPRAFDRRRSRYRLDGPDADRIRAQPIDGPVPRNAHEPGGRRSEPAIVRGGLVPALREHFLQPLLGFAAIANDAQDQSKQQAAVAIVQVRDGALVASDNPFDQRDVVTAILGLHHSEFGILNWEFGIWNSCDA